MAIENTINNTATADTDLNISATSLVSILGLVISSTSRHRFTKSSPLSQFILFQCSVWSNRDTAIPITMICFAQHVFPRREIKQVRPVGLFAAHGHLSESVASQAVKPQRSF